MWRGVRGRRNARAHVRGLLAGEAGPGVGHGLPAEVLHAPIRSRRWMLIPDYAYNLVVETGTITV